VHGAFIGKERDGTFRLPVMNEGMAPATGKKNLVILSNMLDNEKQPVRFDLAACKADSTGSFYVYDPNGYAA
jgi:ABC-type transporter MlaC component